MKTSMDLCDKAPIKQAFRGSKTKHPMFGSKNDGFDEFGNQKPQTNMYPGPDRSWYHPGEMVLGRPK